MKPYNMASKSRNLLSLSAMLCKPQFTTLSGFFELAHLTLFGQLEESEDVMRTEMSTVFPKKNDNLDIAVAVRHNY
jgi:hypothetical protein